MLKEINGTAKISIGLVGSFILGTVTAAGVLYTIRRTEVQKIETAAIQRSVIESKVEANRKEIVELQDDIDIVMSRQEWVVMALTLMAQKSGVTLPPIPGRPLGSSKPRSQ